MVEQNSLFDEFEHSSYHQEDMHQERFVVVLILPHQSVDFPKKKATIKFDEGKTSLRKIAELLDSLGYEPSISLDAERVRQQRPAVVGAGLGEYPLKVGFDCCGRDVQVVGDGGEAVAGEHA